MEHRFLVNEDIYEPHINPRGDVRVEPDIDSIFISCTTLEPYLCNTKFDLLTGSGKVEKSFNTKFYVYMNKREELVPVDDTDDRAICYKEITLVDRNKAAPDPEKVWYQMDFGYLDNIPIYVLFQYDPDAPNLRNRNTQGTDDQIDLANVTELGAVRRLFINRIVLPAAQNHLPLLSKTAKAGIMSATGLTSQRYAVYRTEWRDFAKGVTAQLRSSDLRAECGITIIRFVVSLHGLCLPKIDAERLYINLLDNTHYHVDIVQFHRAEELEPPDGTAILAKIDRAHIRSARETMNLRECYHSELQTYSIGFLADYGGFASYCIFPEPCSPSPSSSSSSSHLRSPSPSQFSPMPTSPSPSLCLSLTPSLQETAQSANDNEPSSERFLTPPPIVNYVQVYNSAAKMARIIDQGLTPAYVFLNKCAYAPNATTKKIKILAEQRLKNLIDFTTHYCGCKITLRLEEVVTYDARVHNISYDVRRDGVFLDYIPSFIFTALMSTQSLYIFHNWTDHVCNQIGDDYELLCNLIRPIHSAPVLEPRVSRRTVELVAKAEYRILYFNNGRSNKLNHAFVTAMYQHWTERQSVERQDFFNLYRRSTTHG